jgi:hypothetical protein
LQVMTMKRWMPGAIALCVLVLLFSRSMMRFFDLDEHQFVAPPALLLQQGAVPYRDYPYFHMPTLIYVNAVLTAWLPYKLLAARTLSVLAGTATVLLLMSEGWRSLAGASDRTRWLVAGGLVLTFMSSRLFTYTSGLAWNHDLAVLCMLGAVLLHVRGLEKGHVAPVVLAGFLFGCAAGIRLSFALAFVPLGLSLLAGRSALSRWGRWAAGGLAALAALVALAPALAGWLVAQEAFVFGNLGYPRLSTLFYRQIGSGAMTVPGKIYHALQTFLTDPGNAVILLLAGAALASGLSGPAVRRSPLRGRLVLIGALLPFLAIGAWGPTPTQWQYYYMLLPFLVLFILWTVAAESGDEHRLRRWRRWVTVGLVLAAGTGLPRWYWSVVLLPLPQHWVPVQVHRLGEWVRMNIPRDGAVLTIEPAVPLEAGVHVYPEYAVGRFVMCVGPLMSPSNRRSFGMAWGDDLERLLARRSPDAILVDDRTAPMVPAFLEHARSHGYTVLRAPGLGYDLWVRPPAGSSPTLTATAGSGSRRKS